MHHSKLRCRGGLGPVDGEDGDEEGDPQASRECGRCPHSMSSEVSRDCSISLEMSGDCSISSSESELESTSMGTSGLLSLFPGIVVGVACVGASPSVNWLLLLLAVG